MASEVPSPARSRAAPGASRTASRACSMASPGRPTPRSSSATHRCALPDSGFSSSARRSAASASGMRPSSASARPRFTQAIAKRGHAAMAARYRPSARTTSRAPSASTPSWTSASATAWRITPSSGAACAAASSPATPAASPRASAPIPPDQEPLGPGAVRQRRRVGAGDPRRGRDPAAQGAQRREVLGGAHAGRHGELGGRVELQDRALHGVDRVLQRQPRRQRLAVGREQRHDLGRRPPAVPAQVFALRRVEHPLDLREVQRQRTVEADQEAGRLGDPHVGLRERALERAQDGAEVRRGHVQRDPLHHHAAGGEAGAREPVVVLRVKLRVARVPGPRLAVGDDRVVPLGAPAQEGHAVVVHHPHPGIVQHRAVEAVEEARALDHGG
ncbi:hypothetical protein PSR1_03260 [Anaeromyxobacter sp. PSR-1]|nr:hypothetical protein PSR1_03260 [Anaeromyxobacter sp. PSR-1]